MKRHDESLLWQYSARELDPEATALVEHHLQECVDCREKLLDVRQARLVLQDAQTPHPKVEWAKVDQGISQIVEKGLERQAKASRNLWKWPLGFALVASAVAAVVLVAPKLEKVPAPVEVAVAAPVESIVGTEVETALGLSKVGVELSMAREGERLNAGEVLRTAVGGRGVMALPDGSRMRLAGGSQLALTRADADDVALTLERGRVGVSASHRQRRGFVVHTNGMSVRVVGTLFTVSQVAGVVEVVVAEGKVMVEPPEGRAMAVTAGERLRFERGQWKPLRGVASPSQIAELNELTAPPMLEAAGAPRAPAGGQLPKQVVGVGLATEPAQQQHEGLLPRKPSVARGQATVWPKGGLAVAESPAPQVPDEEVVQLEEKSSVWPSMGGGPTTYEPRVVKRSAAKAAVAAVPAEPIGAYQLEVETPAPKAEFGSWPKEKAAPAPAAQKWPEPQVPDAEPVAVAPSAPSAPMKIITPSVKAKGVVVVASKGEPLAQDLEAIFLQRAERGIERGICERSLLGLQEIAADPSRNERAEKARILRARCYDSRVRPDLSEIEYRRYLEIWPKGKFVDEARKAIIE